MAKFNEDPQNPNSMPEINDEMADYMSSDEGMMTIHEGQIIHGKILSVDPTSGVIVDIGYKSEGLIPASDLNLSSNSEIKLKTGDEIDVYVLRTETSNGLVALSKSKADQRVGWTELRKAFENKTPVEGTVVTHNKAGFSVSFYGIKAFVPFSQSGLSSNDDPQSIVGQSLPFLVIEFDDRHNKVVASRKQIAQDERLTKRRELLLNLKEGDRIIGTIKSIASFGAFVDIGGIDGLLHISDMAWNPIKSAEEVVKVGQKIELIILKVDSNQQRISLGLKQITQNPWDALEAKYPINSIVTGKVTAMTDFGAFVELEPGIEGMIHVSEMSWVQRIKHPKELVNVSGEVQVKILGIDKLHQRISLSLRQTQPDPWDIVENKYPINSIAKGTITSVTEHGLFVKIEEGVEGLVHVNDLTWGKSINPSEVYQQGQEVDVRVLKFNKAKRRIGLGIKQLTSDPWKTFVKDNKEGSIIKGTVTKVTEGGATVEFDGNIDAFCPSRQLDSHKIHDARQFCKVGDILEFKVIRIEQKPKKVHISRRAILEDQERKAVREYMNQDTIVATNLGEIIKQAVNDKKDEESQK